MPYIAKGKDGKFRRLPDWVRFEESNGRKYLTRKVFLDNCVTYFDLLEMYPGCFEYSATIDAWLWIPPKERATRALRENFGAVKSAKDFEKTLLSDLKLKAQTALSEYLTKKP